MSGERGTEQSNRGPIVVVAIVAGLCGGIASALALRLIENEPAKVDSAASSRPVSADEGLGAVRQELAALRQQIDGLRRPASGSTAAESRSAGPTDAQPAALGPTETATHADITALADALQRLSDRLDASLAPRLSSLAPDPAKREALRPYLDPKHRMPVESYALWTESQLLDAYGPPSYVAPFGSGYQWGYELKDADKRIRFEFTGGRVTNYAVE
ncbi:MAG TPA: hypothetical protein VFY71_00330 [Planctomycetota bacterium]|nr:hypothetical protein [Planctomycetota bacterium]